MDKKYTEKFSDSLLRTSKELLKLQDYINHMKQKMMDYEYPNETISKVSDKEAYKLADEMDMIDSLLESSLNEIVPSPNDDKPFRSKDYRKHANRFINDFGKFKADKIMIKTFGKKQLSKLHTK